METKKCPKCGEDKSISEFGRRAKPPHRLCGYCRKCKNKYKYEKRKSDPVYHRDKHMKQKFGIGIKDYNRLFKQQEGKCKICGTHQSDLKRKLFIDHDHVTGKVRGLLCMKCNTGLGLFKENMILISNALNYLKDHDKEGV